MKIDEIYKGQKVGLSRRGKVITGKVIKVFEDIVGGQKISLASVETPEYELLEVNIKKLIGVVK